MVTEFKELFNSLPEEDQEIILSFEKYGETTFKNISGKTITYKTRFCAISGLCQCWDPMKFIERYGVFNIEKRYSELRKWAWRPLLVLECELCSGELKVFNECCQLSMGV